MKGWECLPWWCAPSQDSSSHKLPTTLLHHDQHEELLETCRIVLTRSATRLAGHLDRGKTASPLGVLDMLGQDEQLGGRPHARRESTMSDMILALPSQAARSTLSDERSELYCQLEKNGPWDVAPFILKAGKALNEQEIEIHIQVK